jgi:hypothetical protein
LERDIPDYGVAISSDLGCEVQAFYASNDLGLVYSLACAPQGGPFAGGLVALAQNSISHLTREGNLARDVPYGTAEKPWRVTVLPIESAQDMRFLASLPDERRAVVYSDTGRVILSLPSGYYERAHAGDLNGNGRSEIVISRRDGFDIFSSGGQRVTSVGAVHMSSNFAIEDIDDDGTGEIIAQTNEKGGRIRVFSGRGNLLGAWNPGFRFYDFAAIRWPSPDKVGLLFLVNGTVVVTDPYGRERVSLRAPGSERLARLTAATLDTGAHGNALVCVASGRVGGPHTVYIWSADGNLLYQRLMPGSGSCVLAPPRTDPTAELCFYVGGRHRIWKYSLAAGNSEDAGR